MVSRKPVLPPKKRDHSSFTINVGCDPGKRAYVLIESRATSQQQRLVGRSPKPEAIGGQKDENCTSILFFYSFIAPCSPVRTPRFDDGRVA